jgi:hypothetical protein
VPGTGVLLAQEAAGGVALLNCIAPMTVPIDGNRRNVPGHAICTHDSRTVAVDLNGRLLHYRALMKTGIVISFARQGASKRLFLSQPDRR